ncbi:hypothetical protein GCM10020358_69250 [Amorphoplanes nipponensis]|uniref:HIT domain-containing protein n=1 Tax=Actinoplanes nipponensis TaxID=135950 RepID=A0A919JUE2_9ACTN|nr:HIT domain-containing protein [Actinoplanes nipponensis]GIE53184.1 hypothetical protein Ani05nite_67180 [Actinoplanes nipponensis]
MSMHESCGVTDHCDSMGWSDDEVFNSIYVGEPPHRVVLSVPGLRLIVDVSPLVAGHLLLVPERHYLSFGHLVPDLAGVVNALVRRLRQAYVDVFGRMAVIEHRSSTTMPSACITHAHWHLLPVDGKQIRRHIVNDGLKPARIQTFEDLHRYASANQSYYYCSDGNSHDVFVADRTIRPQYLRSVVGRMLDIPDPEWDWSVVVRRHLMRETMRLTSGWAHELLP